MATTNHQITLLLLKRLGACKDQRDLFKTTFGRYAELTEESAIRAADAGLSISWLASEVLTSESDAEYQRVCQPADAEYQRVCQPAKDEYQRVRKNADAEYQRVCQNAEDEYKRLCALAFLRIYVAQLATEA